MPIPEPVIPVEGPRSGPRPAVPLEDDVYLPWELPGGPRRRRRPAERAIHRLYLRAAWATLGRLPLLDPATRPVVEGRLIALSRRLDVEPVSAVALASRVHVLLRYKPGQSIGQVVAWLKSGSEEELRRAGHPVHWAHGFAAATVSPKAVRRELRRLAGLGDREDPGASPPTRGRVR